MKWNVDGLKYLYKELEELCDDLEKQADDEAKEGNYNFASVSKNQAYGITKALNWVVKVDKEIKSYREIERIEKESEEIAKKCEKCLTEQESSMETKGCVNNEVL